MEILQTIPLVREILPLLPWLAGLLALWFVWNSVAPMVRLRMPKLKADDIATRVLGDKYTTSKMIKNAERETKKGNHLAAGKLYEDAGELQLAADTYLAGEEYIAAAFVLEKMPGKAEKAAELFLKGGDYKKAAEVYAANGKPAKAAALYEEKGNNLDAARLYAQGQVWDKASDLYLKGGYPLRAAEAFEKQGNFLRAAQCFEKHFMENVTFSTTYSSTAPTGEGKFAQKAGQLFEQAGELARAREIYLRGFFFREAALVSTKLGQHAKAAEYFLRAEDLAAAADAFERGGDAVKAANHRGELAFKAGRVAEAAAFFQKGQDYGRAAELFEQAGMLKEAAGAYEAGESWAAAASVYARAGLKEPAAACFEKGGEFETAGKLYEEAGNEARAAELFEKAGLTYKSGLAAAKAGHAQKAIALLQRVPANDEHFSDATEKLAELFLATGMYALALERVERALGGKPVSRDTLPLYYWQARTHEAAGAPDRALLTYEKVLAEDFQFRDAAARVSALKSGVRADAPTAPRAGAKAAAAPERYRILRSLGKGAMGVVYLARDTLLERDVALKIMAGGATEAKEARQRFEREAKIVAKLRHPNIVTIHDLGYQQDGAPFIAMELLTGRDLMAALREQPPLDLGQGVAALIDVLAGLAHAHAQGVVHRDIKPANVFLSHDGTARIMDFGVARLVDTSMTESGLIVGTADYMSPEQVQGARVDGRSDLFSVGCILYELVSSRRAFAAETLTATFYKITHSQPDFAGVSATPAGQALLPILKRALAKRAEDRYSDAAAFRKDLLDYQAKVFPQVRLRAAADVFPGAPPAATPRSPAPAPPAAATGPAAAPTVAQRSEAPTRALPARFEVKEEIARGPLGVVHRGLDHADGKSVALRLLPQEAGPHLQALAADLKAAAQLQHANVVRVLGLVELAGRRCVVSEHVQGATLQAPLAAKQKLALPQVQTLARTLAQSLAAIHAKGLAHGSVQPSNVMSASGVVKLADVGLGRLHLALVAASPYRAPEARLDAAADVYAYGALLYHLLTGRAPAVAAKPAPHEIDPSVPLRLSTLVMRCLEARPEARFRNAGELFAQLGAASPS
jgi:serine/threonine protein kinase